MQQYPEAIASYDRALEYQPDLWLAWDNRGNILFNLQQYSEAIASYDKVLEYQPDSWSTWENRGRALFYLKEYEKAIASYDKALEIEPKARQIWYRRHLALINLNRFAEAFVSYLRINTSETIERNVEQEWVASLSRVDTWYEWGEGLVCDGYGNYREAIILLDRALEIDPDFEPAWNKKAYAWLRLDCYEECIASYDRAIALKQNSLFAWFNRAVALEGLHQYAEAIASCDLGGAEALRDRDLEQNGNSAETLTYRGQLLQKLERDEEALDSLEQALAVEKDYDRAFYEKARIYAKQNNLDLALKNLEIAVNLVTNRKAGLIFNYRELAETDSNFAGLHDDRRFQALMHAAEKVMF